MSGHRLQINVLSNLFANIWLAGITFLAMPVIYRALGPSQYAVVGMYVLATQWSAFLDLGLSPALGRFAAQQNRDDGSFARVRYLLSWFEFITLALGLLLVLAGLAAYNWAPTLVQDWSAGGEQPLTLLIMILLTLALRVIANLYRAGLTGIELQAQVSLINSVVVSLRLGLPILMALMGQLSLTLFFLVQVLIGCLEALWFRTGLVRTLGSERLQVPAREVKQQLLLGLSIAGLGVLWIVSLQVDKLLLSSKLSLDSFGNYLLAVQLASAVTLITAPIQTAVLPRLTALLASKKIAATAELYTLSGLVCTTVGMAATFAILVCGQRLLAFIGGEGHGLTGLDLVVAVYVLSYTLIALMALAYALQNAAGILRWHWLGAITMSVLQIPLMYLLVQHGDVLLLAIAYMATNLVFVLAWLTLAHRQFLSIGHWQWLRRALLQPLLITVPLGGFCMILFAGNGGLLLKLSQGTITFLLLLSCGVLSNPSIRAYLGEYFHRHA